MYEFSFKDSKDINECKQYLADNYEVSFYSILMEGNRAFQFEVPTDRANSLYIKMKNDTRLYCVSKHENAKSMYVTMNPFVATKTGKYTLKGYIKMKEGN